MDDKSIAESLFAIAKEKIPTSGELARGAYRDSEFYEMSIAELKRNFSRAVSNIQIEAYNRYLANERNVAAEAIKTVFFELIHSANSNLQALDIIADHFGAFDKFSLSLTQSRRSRAGSAFEIIVSELFLKLGYPYSAQANIRGSTPDYILPSISWYNRYPSDTIILTLKRTLRERWRQIVTESSSGTFYLATIDEDISGPGLEQMKDRNITVVLPDAVKNEHYLKRLNVISFEDFFEDHLDPAMARWKKKGAI
ncbi:MAG: hypothetical protein IPL47_17830 [Phyllobacteriaceae bacterium]|nr:hypothetical protein [Phyllobacteriaceae bacterium]